MTPSTKKYKRMRNICGFFSTLCTIGPIIYFIVIAMMAATPVQKVSIGFIASLSIVMSIVNLCLKVHPRSVFWLILLGAYWILGNIFELLVVLFITCFLDEILFTPMYKYARNKYSINKEIDKRG